MRILGDYCAASGARKLVGVVGAVRPSPHAATAAKLPSAAPASVRRRAREPRFLLNRAGPLSGPPFLHDKMLLGPLDDMVHYLVNGRTVEVHPVAHHLPHSLHRVLHVQHLHGAHHRHVLAVHLG